MAARNPPAKLPVLRVWAFLAFQALLLVGLALAFRAAAPPVAA